MAQRYANFDFEQSYTRRPANLSSNSSATTAAGIASLLGDPPVRRQPQSQSSKKPNSQLYDPFDQDEMESMDSRYRERSGAGAGGAEINMYTSFADKDRTIYNYESQSTQSRGGGDREQRVTTSGSGQPSNYSYSSSNQNSKLITASYGVGDGPSSSRDRDTIREGHGNTSTSSRQVDYRDREPLFPSRESEFRNINQPSAGGATWRNRSPSPLSRRHSEYGHVPRNSRRSPAPWDEPPVRRQVAELTPLFKQDAMISHNQSSLMQAFQPQQVSALGMGGPIQFLLPQATSGATSLMGLPIGSQNQFGIQRQAPVQVILGNLPAFNSNLFEQQQQMMSNQYGSSVRGGQSHHYGRERDDHRSGSYRHESDRDRHRGVSRNRDNSPVRRTGGNVSRRTSDRFGSSNANSSPRAGRTNLSPRTGRKREASEREPSTEKKVPRESLEEPVSRRKKSLSKRDRIRRRNRMAKEQEEKDTKDNETLESSENKDKEADTTEGKTDATNEKDKTKTPDQDVVILDEVPAGSEKPKESQANEVEVIDEKEKEKKKSKYDEFTSSLLVCKVCQKGMSDGASFENHLHGRAHYALLRIVEEKFQRRADLLMFESKSQEDEILIEMERLKRAGTLGKGDRQKGKGTACNMCNCNYSLSWGSHKVSYCHRVLKDFLHPTCQTCGTNFVHRMDWVNHLFSLAHFRRVNELKLEGKDVSVHEKLNQDELFAINIELTEAENPASYIIVRNVDWKSPSTEELKQILKGENGELDLPDGEILLPEEYKEDTVVGQEAVITVEGKCCKVCRLHVGRTEKEVLIHCSGRTHYENYITYLKNVISLREKVKQEEEDKAEKAKKVTEAEEKLVEVDEVNAGKHGELEQGSDVPETTVESKDDENETDAVCLKVSDGEEAKAEKEVDTEMKESNDPSILETEVEDPLKDGQEDVTEQGIEMDEETNETELNDEEIDELLLADIDEELPLEPDTTNGNEEKTEKIPSDPPVEVEPKAETVKEEKVDKIETKKVLPRPIPPQPVQRAIRGTPLGVRGGSRGVIIRGALPKVSTRRAVPVPAPRPPSSLARGGGRAGPGRGSVSARGGGRGK